MIIDNRSNEGLRSNLGSDWRLISDQVMGGQSDGTLESDLFLDRDCLRLRGSVSTANNGGFLQMSLEPAGGDEFDAGRYAGILLQVAGNGEQYNLHLRTADLWFPWQSYRSSFRTGTEWMQVRVPFDQLQAYRTGSRFDPERLVRIGLVAIGRDFQADLCLGEMRFYEQDGTAGY